MKWQEGCWGGGGGCKEGASYSRVEDTSHSEDAEAATPPDFVLTQQERQQHEQSSIMYHPPYVNTALHPVLVARKPVDALGHDHCQFLPRSHTNAFYTHTEITHTSQAMSATLPINSCQD